MTQVKIFGLREQIGPKRKKLSDAIHSCVMDALYYPADKRIHRFLLMEEEDFVYTLDRSKEYTIIEISLFEGRSAEAKKKLIQLLFERIHNQAGISPRDVEITIFETPVQNWGIRGLPGDELALDYKVNV